MSNVWNKGRVKDEIINRLYKAYLEEIYREFSTGVNGFMFKGEEYPMGFSPFWKHTLIPLPNLESKHHDKFVAVKDHLDSLIREARKIDLFITQHFSHFKYKREALGIFPRELGGLGIPDESPMLGLIKKRVLLGRMN